MANKGPVRSWRSASSLYRSPSPTCVAGCANVFGRAGLVWGHRCRRARYSARRGTSAAAGAAARHTTAPAHRCNVSRAGRRGTFEHWVATGAPNVASRLLARTFPRGLHQERSTERSRSPNEEGPRTAKSISTSGLLRRSRLEAIPALSFTAGPPSTMTWPGVRRRPRLARLRPRRRAVWVRELHWRVHRPPHAHRDR
jgi:hypothetical protein